MLAALLRACAEASVPPAALGSCIRRRATLVREAGPSLDAELAILVAWAGGVERATHMHGSSQIDDRRASERGHFILQVLHLTRS